MRTTLLTIHWHATQIQAFREALNDARSIASALPGGEMLIEEQEDVIAMLERLRAKKRYVLWYSFPGFFFLSFSLLFAGEERGNENQIITIQAWESPRAESCR